MPADVHQAWRDHKLSLQALLDRLHNRLLANRYSPHQFSYFGHFRQQGAVGKYEDPGRVGINGMPSGYSDVDTARVGA